MPFENRGLKYSDSVAWSLQSMDEIHASEIEENWSIFNRDQRKNAGGVYSPVLDNHSTKNPMDADNTR